jgi:hypothetical protein
MNIPPIFWYLVVIVGSYVGSIVACIITNDPIYMLGCILIMAASMFIRQTQRIVLKVIPVLFPKIHLILLTDYQGRQNYTLGKINDDYTIDTYVYWWENIGGLRLLPNGTVSENSESHYVMFWKYTKTSDAAIQALSYDLPDYETLLDIGDDDVRMGALLELRSKYPA